MITKRNGLFGYIIKQGGEEPFVQGPVFKNIPDDDLVNGYATESVFEVEKNGTSKECLAKKNELICFDKLEPAFGENYIFFAEIDGKIGLITDGYKIDTLIEIEFGSIERHPNEDWYITKKEGKYGIYDYEGKVVLENEWDEIDFFVMSQFDLVRKDDKWGIFDEAYRKLGLEVEYDEIEYEDYFFYVKKKGKWQAFNEAFSPLSDKKFDKLKSLKEHVKSL